MKIGVTVIMVFKDWLSRMGEHRKPEDIGVDEMYMHLAIFIFNFRLFAAGTDMDLALLRLSHMQKGTYYVQI
jgi:hypothetical protein